MCVSHTSRRDDRGNRSAISHGHSFHGMTDDDLCLGLGREQFPDFYVRRPQKMASGDTQVPDDRKLNPISRHAFLQLAGNVYIRDYIFTHVSIDVYAHSTIPSSRGCENDRLGFASRDFLNCHTCLQFTR